MANFTKMLLFAFSIQLLLILCGFTNIPGTALYTWVTNPSGWNQDSLVAIFGDIFTLVGATSIIVGLVFYKSDFIIFSGVTALFFSFGIGIGTLFTHIQASAESYLLPYFGAGAGTSVAMLFVSPILVMYLMALIGWWRGRND